MNRLLLAIWVLPLLGAGCRSAFEETTAASSPAAAPKSLPTPVGQWTKSFDDGTHLDLEIEPTYIRLALQPKNSPGCFAFTGTCYANSSRVLSGIITSIKWEGEESEKAKMIVRMAGEFRYSLWYEQNGDRLTVLRIEGDCFDKGGEANCIGPYEKLIWRVNGNKSERVEALDVRPAHFETWTIGDAEGTSMVFGGSAERERFAGPGLGTFAPSHE